MDTSSQSASLTQASSGTNSASLSGFISSGEQLQQRTALTWIRAFVMLDPKHLLPFASGIIGAVLPCFVMGGGADGVKDRKGDLLNPFARFLFIVVELSKFCPGLMLKLIVASSSKVVDIALLSILETAVRINETLLTFVSEANDLHGNGTSENRESTPRCVSASPLEQTNQKNEAPIRAIHAGVNLNEPSIRCTRTKSTTRQDVTSLRSRVICTDAILEATCRLLNHQGLLTRLAALRWIEVLTKVRLKEVLSHISDLLPLMLNLLSDSASEFMVDAILETVFGADSNPTLNFS
ncbi:unnamed protein product [Echinostoma caproni]|uniref:Vac14_Fig4_bd domain-containing protein n=1 Tax=Echinostoma caproni TaxID=27848 RepID=A0A183BFQ7_9TREM|nr:unnamed protein product [Echinostoma caproni]